jgi:mitochondrial fission protein ELM1
LSEEELAAVGLRSPWPDILISCRPEVSALALSIKKASGSRTRVIHMQNPNGGKYHFDLSAFDLVVRQSWEKFAGYAQENVISVVSALHGLTPSIIQGFRRSGREAASRLRITKPLVVLVGGSDDHLTLTGDHYKNFGKDIRDLARQHDGSVLIITSRRTDDEGKARSREATLDSPNVIFDNPNVPCADALGAGDNFLITAETTSIVAEASATGQPCSIYEFDGYLRQHPVDETFSILIAKGALARFSLWPQNHGEVHDEIPNLVNKICAKLHLGTQHFG